MSARPLRLYADTSVFGGAFDEEFRAPTLALFDAVRSGAFRLLTSELEREELVEASEKVRDFFLAMARHAEIIPIDDGAIQLRDAYHQAGVLSTRWTEDALHVALATVAGADLIVSWNFKHIVHFERIPMYNGVNMIRGFQSIRIHSPSEVAEHGPKDEDV
jgi:predicted nucleic acid-binding protein